MLNRRGITGAAILFWAMAGWPPMASANTPLVFTPLSFSGNSAGIYQAQQGDFVFALTQPDDARHPQIWDSRLNITRDSDGAHCATVPMLVRWIYAARGGEFALALHVSGADYIVELFDSRTCAPRMPPLQAASDKVIVNGARVELWPACAQIAGDLSLCTAARIFTFDQDARPQALMRDARALTRRVLGVAFSGTRYVRHVKSPRARLVSP